MISVALVVMVIALFNIFDIPSRLFDVYFEKYLYILILFIDLFTCSSLHDAAFESRHGRVYQDKYFISRCAAYR